MLGVVRPHIAKVLYTHTEGRIYKSDRIGYSPTVDLAPIGGCQGRDIELDRRVGAFQAVRLVQLLHNVLHFPIGMVIGYRHHIGCISNLQTNTHTLAVIHTLDLTMILYV